jgi:hypothetical protein
MQFSWAPASRTAFSRTAVHARQRYRGVAQWACAARFLTAPDAHVTTASPTNAGKGRREQCVPKMPNLSTKRPESMRTIKSTRKKVRERTAKPLTSVCVRMPPPASVRRRPASARRPVSRDPYHAHVGTRRPLWHAALYSRETVSSPRGAASVQLARPSAVRSLRFSPSLPALATLTAAPGRHAPRGFGHVREAEARPREIPTNSSPRERDSVGKGPCGGVCPRRHPLRRSSSPGPPAPYKSRFPWELRFCERRTPPPKVSECVSAAFSSTFMSKPPRSPKRN